MNSVTYTTYSAPSTVLTTGMPMKPRFENTNSIWKSGRFCRSFSKRGVRIMPATMKQRNMPSAIRATVRSVCLEMCPTALSALEMISSGLNTVTIIWDIWALVWASSMPFLVRKNPAPIIIRSESI